MYFKTRLQAAFKNLISYIEGYIRNIEETGFGLGSPCVDMETDGSTERQVYPLWSMPRI
jgi:hypothetical protein